MQPRRPNLLLLTADDMNWDAVGAFGCPVAETTPHLDRLAREGMRFDRAHVTIAVCQPSRSVLMTGRYPHNSSGEGFWHLRRAGVPILPALLREAGYRAGILGKVGHSTPYADFDWDLCVDQPALGEGRNPAIYRRHMETFLQEANAAGQPWFLMVNSHDPHRPFVGHDPQAWYEEAEPPAAAPARVFAPEEITVPGCLPDLPAVRQELAAYYSSVRRCDDTLGGALELLDAAGQAEKTLVLFLSDNGMAFPFAKTNCYVNSTRTPWIVRFPGVAAPGTVEADHFVSGVDLLPTMLDAADVPLPAGVDGASFLPLLRGEAQAGRDRVYTQFHQTSAKRNYPMRCVQDRQYAYIWNPWADGARVFRNESQSGLTMAAMRDAAVENADIAARVALFLHRCPEELYDTAADPDSRINLIDDAGHAEARDRLRADLEAWMERTGDPALPAFRRRDDRTYVDAWLAEQVTALQANE